MRGFIGSAVRLALLALVVAVYLAILLFAPSVRATVEDELELLVDLTSRLSFSEALDSYPDAALIVQVTEAHGETPHERLRWLSGHSPCVAGRLTPAQLARRYGNCRWARNLTSGSLPPIGWPWSVGYWEQRTLPRWRAHQPVVRALVVGDDPYRPCDEEPYTWGAPRDHEVVDRRGSLRLIECEGTRNLGYARATDGGPA